MKTEQQIRQYLNTMLTMDYPDTAITQFDLTEKRLVQLTTVVASIAAISWVLDLPPFAPLEA